MKKHLGQVTRPTLPNEADITDDPWFVAGFELGAIIRNVFNAFVPWKVPALPHEQAVEDALDAK